MIWKETISQDKTFLVEHDGTLEPRCRGFRADETEERNALLDIPVSSRRMLEDHVFKVIISLERSDLGIR